MNQELVNEQEEEDAEENEVEALGITTLIDLAGGNFL